MMPDVQSVLGLLLVVGVLALCGYGFYMAAGGLKKRVLKALEDSGRALGLRPADPVGDFDEAWGGLGGTLKGVKVTVSGGMRYAGRNPGVVAGAGPAAAAVPIGLVEVHAPLSPSLPFALSIRRAGTPGRKDVTTGDAEFDRGCAVETGDVNAARRLLEDRRLRARIRRLVDSGVRMARVSSDEVAVEVFDLKQINAVVRDAVETARAMGERHSERG